MMLLMNHKHFGKLTLSNISIQNYIVLSCTRCAQDWTEDEDRFRIFPMSLER